MKRANALLWAVLLVFGILTVTSHSAGAADKLDFNRDIRSILSNNCFACHGPDAKHAEADLRIDLRDRVTTANDEGRAAIVPGNPAASELVRRINAAGDERMPPEESHKSLSSTEKALLIRWIAEGAEYKEHWAFVAPVRPKVPPVNGQRFHNPIDAFVADRLRAGGLSMSGEADKAALIRRVSLDLTGLPPTIAEIEAFLADTSESAYETVVDRLLASPHYGEHRARYWMDYARYGDTTGIHVDGYQSRWPYRDYVIKAFNQDLRYDQFTREQLAGDLMLPERVDQLVATGLIRCGISTGEGGTIIEELRVNLARERTEMFGAVYLGLTTGCAVCHDHKYDPLSQKDFYALSAFFNNIAEKASCDDRADWPPNIMVPKDSNREAYDAMLQKKANVLRALAKRRGNADQLIANWLAKGNLPQAVAADGLELRLRLDENYRTGDPDNKLLHNSAPGAKQATFTAHGPVPHWGEETNLWPSFRFETNTRVDVSPAGDFEKDQPFSCGGWIKPRDVPGGSVWNTKAGALIARMDAANHARGWNLYYDDGTVLVQLVHAWPDAISIKTIGTTEHRSPFVPSGGSLTETMQRGAWSHVFFTYDGSGKAAGLKIYVNGLEQKVAIDHDKLTGSIRTEAPTWLGRRHDSEPMQATGYQDIRMYRRELSQQEVQRLPREDIAAEIVATKKPADWTLDQRKIVEDVYFEHYDQESIALTAQLPAMDAELVRLAADGAQTLVCREKPGTAYADVLDRGVFSARKERVLADVPHFLPPLPTDAPRDRLALANWVLSPENPLTARLTVNRMWQEVFGSGLVESSEDFGTVGDQPSHPELLDWLAVDFVESGWQVKRLYKLLVMSAAYRQSTSADETTVTADPKNRLLARGPRFRMPGEMLRDMALQTSGLLVETLGGPSVNPYQPPGVWETGSYGNTRYTQQHGANLYRRSLYTYWKRMAPMPNMEAFDATDRSASCVRRQRTNTPLAALVLLNDPQFLEAARNLSVRVIQDGGVTSQERFDFLGRVLLSRPFQPAEHIILERALQLFTARYQPDEAAAKQLLSVGESPVNTTLPATEQAIWMMMATTVMNSDEAINK